MAASRVASKNYNHLNCPQGELTKWWTYLISTTSNVCKDFWRDEMPRCGRVDVHISPNSWATTQRLRNNMRLQSMRSQRKPPQVFPTRVLREAIRPLVAGSSRLILKLVVTSVLTYHSSTHSAEHAGTGEKVRRWCSVVQRLQDTPTSNIGT